MRVQVMPPKPAEVVTVEENLGWVLDEPIATVGAVACPTDLPFLSPSSET